MIECRRGGKRIPVNAGYREALEGMRWLCFRTTRVG